MAGTPKHRLSLRDVLTDGRIALMLPLGFSSGLPFLLVFSTLSAWLREAGISRTEIGLLSWVALAYSFKFLWAPIVDRYDAPILSRLLGRRRGWMALSQIVVALGLIGIAFGDPQSSLGLTVAAALLVAFASATQDVVIDGWRIDVAATERQGMMAASYQLGYRLALICAGAGALYIAEFVNWRSAYLAMAALMAVGLVGTLLAPRVDESAARQHLPFAAADHRAARRSVPAQGPDADPDPGAHRLLPPAGFRGRRHGQSALYRPRLLQGRYRRGLEALRHLGRHHRRLRGRPGAYATRPVVDAADRRRHRRLIQPDVRLARRRGRRQAAVHDLSISIDNFAAGFAGSALIAYMSGLTSPGFAATQYALLSSLYALPGKLIGGASGAVVDAYGYPLLFTATASIGIPLVILCFIVRRDTMQTVKEKDEEFDEAAAVGAGSRA